MKSNQKSEASTTNAKEKATKEKTESQPASSIATDVNKKTKKTQQKDSSTSSAQGLAALKSLIAKAAAGTLSSKSSSTKTSTEAAVKNDDKSEILSATKLSDDEQPKISSGSNATNQEKTSTSTSTSTSISTSTSTSTGLQGDVGVQENDYWMEEKLKMQNTPAYQSFQKGAMLKKNLTSKGTSPPPQTISTQVCDSRALSCLTTTMMT